MIQFQDITKFYDKQTVFSGITWRVPDRGCYGLVGPNGAGKTTLLRLLIGSETPDIGTVLVPNHVRVGYLPQEVIDTDVSVTLMDTILSGRPDLLAIEARLAKAEEELSDGDAIAIAVHADLRETYERDGGYLFRSTAREIASGMGFRAEQFDEALGTFSGGWRMRAILGRLLLSRPHVLLMDEPTNHLDAESIKWLEQFLKGFDGATIVVSHDRHFLNTMVDGIVELELGRLTTYTTNYDGYRREKVENRDRLIAAANQQGKEIAKIERFIERFRAKATKAKQVKSRIKLLDKVDRIGGPDQEEKPIHFAFPQPDRMPKILIECRDIAKSYGDNVVYAGVDFTLFRGDKVAFVGPNGAGKTTLLKMLAGFLEPDSGEVEASERLQRAFYAQHALEQLDPQSSVFDEVSSVASLEEKQRVRSVMGALGFSGDEVFKQISVLSGGEKARVAIGKILFSKANVLLFDEPTNHLDIPSRQVLEYALNVFEGAVVVVSHDRYFLNEVVEKVVHIEKGVLTEFVGTYDNYLEKYIPPESSAVDDVVVVNPNSKKEARRAAAELRTALNARTKDLKKELKALEKTMEAYDVEIAELEASLAEPSTYNDSENAQKLQVRYGTLKSDYDDKLERWGEVAEAIEAVEAELVE